MLNIYLDNAATTPLLDEVKDYLISILDVYGNPSSTHSVGDEARYIVNNARTNVAKFINAENENMISFTSGASASNSAAISGFCNKHNYPIVLYSPIAHKSMLYAAKSVKSEKLIVNKNGDIDLEYLADLIEKYNGYDILVALDVANSEIGTIQDISAIDNICNKKNITLLLDYTGLVSTKKIDVQTIKSNCIVVFSGHKIGALKGVGVLYKSTFVSLKPFVYGSQDDIFAGTENVLGIASLGKACEVYKYNDDCSNAKYVYEKLKKKISDVLIVGHDFGERRLSHNLFISFDKIDGQRLSTLLDIQGIQVSTGSACNSFSTTPSNTLLEIELNNNRINSCIRITFTGKETIEQLDYLYCQIIENVNRLRC